MQFDLVSLETVSERTAPVVEVSAVMGEGDALPHSFGARNRAELDRVISELERTAAVLRAWRAYLPG
jgi:hypothetical protein